MTLITPLLPALALALSTLSGCALLEDKNTSTPSVSVLAPLDGDIFTVAEIVDFQAQVSDSGDPLVQVALSIDSDIDGELCVRAPGTTGLVDCASALSEGTHTITFSAQDLDGNVGSAQLGIIVLGDDGGTTDGGTTDGGTTDGGTTDGGTSDGGTTDGGTSDGGTSDGGTGDGGTGDGGTTDGGTGDGGTSDGGTSDGGTTDGGTSDGGTSDGGTTDGGTSDGGTSDGGTSDGGTSDGGTR